MEITDKFIPAVPKSIFPDGKARFHIFDMLMGKVANERKLVQLYSWEIFGIYGK